MTMMTTSTRISATKTSITPPHCQGSGSGSSIGLRHNTSQAPPRSPCHHLDHTTQQRRVRQGLDIRAMDGAQVKMQNLSSVCYLFIYSLFLLYLFLFASKLHVWELTMARLPPYTRTPASMAAYDDPQTSHWSPQHHSSSRSAGLEPWVCLFVLFLFFLDEDGGTDNGPRQQQMYVFFFFMLFHLTHVFFSLFYLFNEMRTSTNPLTDKEELWRSIVVWSLWTRGMLFYRIFFFLIGIFWADISLMYIGLPSC